MVVELIQQWIKRLLDHVKINYPARVGVYCAFNGNAHSIGMAVQTLALMAFGDLGQPVRGFKAKICVQFQNGPPDRGRENRGDSTRFGAFCDASERR